MNAGRKAGDAAAAAAGGGRARRSGLAGGSLAAALAALAAALVSAAVSGRANDAGPASGGAPGAYTERSLQQRAAPYDGRYTFTRVRYGSGRLGGFGRRGGGAWAHDYPDADLNLQTILEELTTVRPAGVTNVLDLEDPEIFRHPILYMAEPGFWTVTEEGAANLRTHLLKGGLIVFDDFEARQWFNFEAQVRRVLPGRELVEIGPDHPVFDSFFFVEDIYVPHPLVRVTPRYFAVFEDDDPRRRMMMLVNYNSDLAEYWEWSPTGQFGVDPTNDAYRLGVNYIVYALTH